MKFTPEAKKEIATLIRELRSRVKAITDDRQIRYRFGFRFDVGGYTVNAARFVLDSAKELPRVVAAADAEWLIVALAAKLDTVAGLRLSDAA